MTRILVVDDEAQLRRALDVNLAARGYDVDAAASGEEALQLAAATPPDVVLLDLGLPGIDGLEVCRRLRQLENRVPILVLTARDAVADRIDGLDVGADDYMVKPFDVGELKARVRALLRRSAAPRQDEPQALSFAEVALDDARHGAVVGESFVELTRTEYQLLELLLANPGRVLPHSLIYERVWGYDFGPTSNALRVYIGYLRRKLHDAGSRQLIHTVRGVGYVLREP
jgi:two-component system response regulator MprA